MYDLPRFHGHIGRSHLRTSLVGEAEANANCALASCAGSCSPSAAGDLIMRSACIFSLLLCIGAVGVRAQQSDSGQTVLTVRSTLVQAPALVKTKGGQVMLKLTATSPSPTTAYH